MGQPNPYSRAYGFGDYTADNPSEPLPGDQLDAELDAVELTLDDLVTNIGLIQADDGGLRSGIVDYDSLDGDVKTLLADGTAFNLRGAWATATAYEEYDVVKEDSRTWVCLVDHTSGTFATDESNDKWAPLTAEQGPTGATGATGATGSTGATGAAGADGVITAIASQTEAAAATDNTKGMTPLRVDQEIAARAYQGFALFNGYIAASVAANALTITLKTLADATPAAAAPVRCLFPDETLATGKPDFLTISSATTLTVPDTATLGTTNSTAFRLWVLLFNDGQLGVVNCLSGTSILALPEGELVSTTAVSTGSDSAQVIYTTSALTNKPYRIVGYLDWAGGLATAGTWSAAPTVVHQFGAGSKRPGDVVQVKELSSGATDTSTTTVPEDDTIPQNTEGEEWAAGTLAVTPKSAANLIDVAFEGYLGSQALASVALYVDTTADALSAALTNPSTTSPRTNYMTVRYRALAGSTTARTYKMRFGPSTAGTAAVNGGSGGRLYGGVCLSRLIAHEIQA